MEPRRSDVGMIGEIGRMQRQLNDEMAAMTPEERAAAAVEQLRYIATVEPSSYGYLFDEED